jgi:DNA-binding response OmpR family regulator
LARFLDEANHPMAREKILVVDKDLDNLSRIYLALIHRKFKAEACNNSEEISARIRRFKPAIIILNLPDYSSISDKLKIPAIVLLESGDAGAILNYGDLSLKKPVQIDELIKTIEMIV